MSSKGPVLAQKKTRAVTGVTRSGMRVSLSRGRGLGMPLLLPHDVTMQVGNSKNAYRKYDHRLCSRQASTRAHARILVQAGVELRHLRRVSLRRVTLAREKSIGGVYIEHKLTVESNVAA